MFRFFLFLKGYYLITVEGLLAERFINLCKVKKIYLWELKNSNNIYRMKISVADYNILDDIVNKTNVKVDILEKYGLPFLFLGKKNRTFYLVFILLALMLVFTSNLFIWKIDFIGNYTITDEQLEEYKYKLKKRLAGVDIVVINENVEASYISETLYNVHNTGKTDIKYQLDITVTKNEKITWEVSGDLNAAAKGTIKLFQVNIENKLGIDYKKTNEKTEKVTEKIDLVVESNSRAIIYLMGRARVTNGVGKISVLYLGNTTFAFEFFTIVNQYPRLEKRSLC